MDNACSGKYFPGFAHTGVFFAEINDQQIFLYIIGLDGYIIRKQTCPAFRYFPILQLLEKVFDHKFLGFFFGRVGFCFQGSLRCIQIIQTVFAVFLCFFCFYTTSGKKADYQHCQKKYVKNFLHPAPPTEYRKGELEQKM